MSRACAFTAPFEALAPAFAAACQAFDAAALSLHCFGSSRRLRRTLSVPCSDVSGPAPFPRGAAAHPGRDLDGA